MLKDKFIKASTWLFIATMVTNVFNYIFQVAMGRLLSTEDFGLMNALFALFLITSLPFSTIMTVLAKYVSNYLVSKDHSSIKGLFIKSYKNVFRIALVLFFIYLCLSFSIRSFLKLDNITPVILLGCAIFSSLVLPLNSAFLQGLQRFWSLGAVNCILGPAKFVLCSLFVILGFRVNGVLCGIILSLTNLLINLLCIINKVKPWA
mgnify:CR=1 FL=1